MGHVDRYMHKDMNIKGCFKRLFAKLFDKELSEEVDEKL